MNKDAELIKKKNWERFLLERLAKYLVVNGLKGDKKALERFQVEIGNLDKKKGLFMHYCDHKYKKNSKTVFITYDYDKIMSDRANRSEEDERTLEKAFERIKLEELYRLRTDRNEYTIAQTVNALLARMRKIKAEIAAMGEKKEEKQKPSLNDEPPKKTSFTAVTPEDFRSREISKKEHWLDFNAQKILDGPKANSLFGKDNNVAAINPLYTLSEEILTLMMMDQEVEPRNDSSVNDITTVYTPYDSYIERLKPTLFAKYGVNNLDQLLNKYGKIRDAYFKKYEKLSAEAKQAYAFSRQSGFLSAFDTTCADNALGAENLLFPPSREQLIAMMNRRILQADRYSQMPSPKARKDNISAEANDDRQYREAKDYYKNLTKNMTPQEISKLYLKTKYQLDQSMRYLSEEMKNKDFNYQSLSEAVLQRMFLEIIFDKEGKRYVDTVQLQAEFERMAKQYFDEDLEFAYTSKRELSIEEQKERANTIYEDFQKYEEHCQMTKQKPMSLEEFAREKFGISNMKEIEHLIDGVNKQR